MRLLFFLFGQIGELVIVIGHGGSHAGEDALLDPAHDIAALAKTVLGPLLSGVLLDADGRGTAGNQVADND